MKISKDLKNNLVKFANSKALTIYELLNVDITDNHRLLLDFLDSNIIEYNKELDELENIIRRPIENNHYLNILISELVKFKEHRRYLKCLSDEETILAYKMYS